MFQFHPEPKDALLRVALSGFWDADAFRRYLQGVQAAMAQMQSVGGCRRILVDMSDYPIQATAIADMHGRALATAVRRGVRVAIVMTSALSKLQAQRVATGTGHVLFADVQEARDWLVAD